MLNEKLASEKQNVLSIVLAKLAYIDPEPKVFLIRFLQLYPTKSSEPCLKDLAKQVRMNDRVVSRALTTLVEQKILCRTESRKGKGCPRSHYCITQSFNERLDNDAKLKNDAYEDIIRLLLGIHAESEGIDKNLAELNKRVSSKISDSEDQLLDMSKRFLLSTSERLLLALLFTHADYSGTVKNLSFQKLMSLTGMSKRRVLKQLAKLKKYNYLYKYTLDFQGVCFFKDITGVYSLNLTHPFYGQHQLVQRYVVLSHSYKDIISPAQEASQLLNIRKNDYELNFNRNWPMNSTKSKLYYSLFFSRIQLIQKELLFIFTTIDILSSLLKVNNQSFEKYLQAKLEQYALVWLQSKEVIIRMLESTGDITIPDQIKDVIKKDLAHNNDFGDIEPIIDVLALASLAIAFNYYISLGGFYYHAYQHKRLWQVNFISTIENLAATPLVIIYTYQPLKKGKPQSTHQYAPPLMHKINYKDFNAESTWLTYEDPKKFIFLSTSEQSGYPFSLIKND